MAKSQNRPTQPKKRNTLSTFEMNQMLRDQKRLKSRHGSPKAKPDTYKVRKAKKVIT